MATKKAVKKYVEDNYYGIAFKYNDGSLSVDFVGDLDECKRELDAYEVADSESLVIVELVPRYTAALSGIVLIPV